MDCDPIDLGVTGRAATPAGGVVMPLVRSCETGTLSSAVLCDTERRCVRIAGGNSIASWSSRLCVRTWLRGVCTAGVLARRSIASAAG